MPIAFNQVGVFGGVAGGPNVLSGPTSLQFGPDGRLYVTEQNGSVNAFTVELQNGEYVATSHEQLEDASGNEIVKNIQNHNDDGSEDGGGNRQVTGIVVGGTEEIPVVYISSSDPRISSNNDTGLDTNSGVVSRATWNSNTGAWDVVDLVRGLPRSEENHAVNGMVLSPDGTKLLLQVGGFTNNGAPSSFFSYTAEYVLSGLILELDLAALDALPDQIDPQGGQNDTARTFKYDLPTLDDPNIENVTDGVGEDEFGMDEAGPWGGNDGLNMAILPADAPLRVFAEGTRNAYDLAQAPDGTLYTVDNGSNGGLGGNPNTENGDDDEDGVFGEAINTPNNGGTGDPEPLLRVDEGAYFGHPNPVRSNQNMEWTVYNNSGNPDTSLDVNTVADISALVPDAVQIAEGFLIDPSKFAVGPGQTLEDLSPAEQEARLLQSGIRVEYSSAESPSIVTVGSSTNGILVYDSGGAAFNGAIDGKLFVTQFNDNITLLNINADGTALEPVFAEGPDGIFGTADDVEQDPDGILFVANNSLGVSLANPLDVTQGPGGTLWVAEIGGNEITVLAPSIVIDPTSDDSDGDGILNINDPFLRDATNGISVVVAPGTPTVWEFSQGANDTTPGPDGFGGGVTGVMIDGTTDFEAFLQSESTSPGQNIQLDNVKFVTAALGGSTTIEEVNGGDPTGANNDGKFLFHTGFKLAENVETFTVKWVVANPGAVSGGSDITNNFQQIGGYIGDGTQSNFVKIVAIATNNDATTANIQIVLEDGDSVLQTIDLPANDIFNNAILVQDSIITFELAINPTAATAIPKATFVTTSGEIEVTSTTVLDLSGSAVLETILGQNTIQGQDIGIAAGLFSSNVQGGTDTFQAVFDSITVSATEAEIAPDAVDDSATTGVDTVLAIPVAQLLANDTDANVGDTLVVTGVSNAQNGTVSLDGGIVTFTPNSGFEGQASFDYTISDGTGTPDDTATVSISVADAVVLFRLNAGGPEIAASVDDPLSDMPWAANTSNGNGATVGPDFSFNTGQESTQNVSGRATTGEFALPDYVPQAVFTTERYDPGADPDMVFSFGNGTLVAGTYTVNIYAGNGFDGTSEVGERIFNIDVEGGAVDFEQIDLVALLGDNNGGKFTWTGEVTDGTLDIAFPRNANSVENPLVNAIEVIGGAPVPVTPTVDIVSGDVIVSEGGGQVFVSVLASETVPAGPGLSFTYVIEGVSASPEIDYVPDASLNGAGTATFTGTATIAGGSSDFQIPIDILQDEDIEPDETFTVTLVSVGPGYEIGNGTATITIEDDDSITAPGEVLFRINAGGAEVASTDGGPAWSADQGVVANAAAVVGDASPYLVDRNLDSDNVTYGVGSLEGANTTGAPDALFTTERFSELANPNNIGYAFDVANGDYTVNLYFDELFFTAPGARVFDVEIEGNLVLDDFDSYVASGNTNNTVLESFDVTVNDGELNLEFLKGPANNPHVAAIEIIATGDVVPPSAEISIGAPVPASVTEGGDSGVTTLTFPISFDQAPNEDVTVEYSVDINGVATTGLTQVIGSTGGNISVAVANDDIDNDAETVTVTLTGIPLGEDVASLGTAVTAVATVTEDDVVGDSFNGVPAGDFSNENTNPDDVTLNLGTNTLVTTGEFGDADYITFEVQQGQQLAAINLTGYIGGQNAAFLGIQIGDTMPSQDDIQNGIATLDGGTVYNEDQIDGNLLPLLATNTVENAGQPTNGLTLPLGPGLYTLWFNQNQNLTESSLELITEEILTSSATDIDGDGILNTDDPFAYDATNGGAQALLPGGEFTQDFNADTTDPFSAAGGFTGILVNPDFDPVGTSADDPYGDRTSGEPTVNISGGSLNVTSSNFDAFTTSATDASNTLKDGYQSGADVSGVDQFEVHARANSPDWFTKANTTNGYEQFGITVGAGGVDDFVKLVVGDAEEGPPRVQIAHNNSLTTGELNYPFGNPGGPTVDLSLVGDIEFRLIIDKVAGTVVGQVDFYAAADSQLLESFITPPAQILAGSSFESALNGENPLTNNEGGIAYGIFVSDWGGAGADNVNQIEAKYDFLTIRSLDEVSTLISISGTTIVEGGDIDTTDAVFTLNASDPALNSPVELLFSTDNGATATAQTVTFINGVATLSVPVGNDDLANGPESVEVTLVSVTTPGIGLNAGAAVATIEVTEDDFAPEATTDIVQTTVNTAVTFNPADNDTDPDNDSAALIVTTIDNVSVVAAQATVELLAGQVTVTPLNGFTGDVTFDYTVIDPAGNATIGTATVAVGDLPALLALDGDLDGDGTINSADDDIDGDGILNLDDRTAYDNGASGIPTFTNTAPILLDFTTLADGATPFEGGFTGLAQTSNGSPELNYSNNTAESGGDITAPAAVQDGRLVIQTTNDDTAFADSGFTFLADTEGESFVFAGTFDNPVFGATDLPTFSQYGLLLSLTGAEGVTGANFVKLVTGNPGGGVEFSGAGDFSGPGKPPLPAGVTQTNYAQVALSLEVTVAGGSVTLVGKASYLDGNGNLLGEVITAGDTVNVGTPFYNALTGAPGASTVAFGITSTDVGDGGSFNIGLQDLSLSKPADITSPQIVLAVTPIDTATDNIVVTATFSDDIDPANSIAIDGDELALVFGASVETVIPTFVNNNDGTATYTFIAPAGGWVEPIQVSAVADSFADAAGNTNTATAPIAVQIGEPPINPEFGLNVLVGLTAADGIATGGSYGQGAVGSAELDVMSTVNSVQSSNFGANSFTVTNTGDKKIAAVFIDFRDALFGDSVVDFDGSSGDTTFKKFQTNSGATETDVFFDASDDNVYYLPGEPPLPNTTGAGLASAGGFRGLLLKAGADNGGFESGETVGFSGDMDPNSIAGLLKGGANGVDTNAINGWDVGGVSGAEVAGSKFFVLFDDGTTASGVLGNNGTQAGSIGKAVEGQAEVPVTIEVNGGSGVYGGVAPTIVVSGMPGQLVQVVLAKGLQPVTNDTVGTGGTTGPQTLVEDRLTISHPDFPVNNAFDFQTVEVTIGANGTVVVPTGAFTYSTTTSGVSFPGSDVAPIAIGAIAINNEGFAIGSLARDYLTNPTESPVGAIPIIAISGGNIAETGDTGTTNAVFTLTTSDSGLNGEVDLSVSTDGGITTTPQTVTFTNGVATIILPVANDNLANGTETVELTLVSATTPGFEIDAGAAVATFDVTEDDFAPVAVADTPSTPLDTAITFNPAANDTDGDDLNGDLTVNAIDITGVPTNVTMELVNGEVTVTPTNGFTGDVTFGYTVADPGGNEATGTVTVTVEALGNTVIAIAGGTTPETGDTGTTDAVFTLTASDNGLNGEVDLSVSTDGGITTTPQTVTFTNGVATIILPVANDNLANGTETVELTLVSATTPGFEIDAGAAVATFDVTEDDFALESLTIQAEDIPNVTTYRLQNDSDAEGGAMLSLGDGDVGETGTASFTFTGTTGTYDVFLGAFDENDGSPAASLTVAQNGTSIGTVVLDQDPGGNAASPDTKVERFVAEALITNGQTITVTGFESGGEQARFDFIRFVPNVPPVPTLSITATTNAAEPNDNGLFTVNLSQPATTDTVITYGFTGTASAGTDYTTLSGTVIIPANQISATIPVMVEDDSAIEGPESVIVTLTGATGSNAVLGAVSQASILIEDDEVPNLVTIAATTPASEPDIEGIFTVSLDAIATTDTIISYSVGGTATPGTDYTTLSGTVTITAGNTDALIQVPALNDNDSEGNETVIVTLESITQGDANVVLGASDAATLTLGDDDGPPPTTFTVQAEDIVDITAYYIQNDIDADGGAMLSLGGGAANETGTATFTFTGPTGIYNVVLGSFDENDGGSPAASLEVSQNGTSLGKVFLDQDPGGNAASPDTKVERSLPQTVLLTNGATITVTGVESENEQARFDFIRFEPDAPAVPTAFITADANGEEAGEVPGQFTVSLSAMATSETVVTYSVGGTATPGPGADYQALSGSVIIPGNQQSATITVPVQQDSDVEGTESVIVTLTGVTGSDAALGATTAATVFIADDEALPLSTLTFEAETADTITNYRNENIGAASEGIALSFLGGNGGESGSASFIFGDTADELTGTYDVVIGTFDESDGLAFFTVDLTDFETGITTEIGSWNLDASLGSLGANAATFITPTMATGISLTAGDIITVNGFENGSEHARLDYLQLVPTI